eukprot:Clim_evm77s207 gene=Clim_evmTU77s207
MSCHSHWDQVLVFSHFEPEIRDILADEVGLSNFVQYLEEKHSLKFLEFVLRVESLVRAAKLLELTGESPDSVLQAASEPTDDEYKPEQFHTCDAKATISSSFDFTTASKALFAKYLTAEAKDYIGLDDVTVRDLHNELYSKHKVSLDCWQTVLQKVQHLLDVCYKTPFYDSRLWKQHIASWLERNSVALEDVLFSSKGMKALTEFMDGQGLLNMLGFWLSAMTFRRHYLSNAQNVTFTMDDYINDVMAIYQKYVIDGSQHPVQVPDEIKKTVDFRVNNDMSMTSMGKMVDVFGPMEKFSAEFISEVIYPAFIRSRQFLDMIKSYTPDGTNYKKALKLTLRTFKHHSRARSQAQGIPSLKMLCRMSHSEPRSRMSETSELTDNYERIEDVKGAIELEASSASHPLRLSRNLSIPDQPNEFSSEQMHLATYRSLVDGTFNDGHIVDDAREQMGIATDHQPHSIIMEPSTTTTDSILDNASVSSGEDEERFLISNNVGSTKVNRASIHMNTRLSIGSVDMYGKYHRQHLGQGKSHTNDLPDKVSFLRKLAFPLNVNQQDVNDSNVASSVAHSIVREISAIDDVGASESLCAEDAL